LSVTAAEEEISMRGLRFLTIITLALGLVPAAAAQQQKKFKDEGLQQYLVPQITDIQARLDKITEKLGALEAEVGKLKEQQAALADGQNKTHGLVNATDTSVTNLRVSYQSDILDVKTNLVEIRRNMNEIAETMRRNAPAPQAAAPVNTPPAAAAPPPADGYVTQVSESEVTINLGSAAGIRVGMRFSVYHGSDLQSRIGIVEITDVTDANNSRAKILEIKPDAKFQFSDVVRPL
jgi:hypothetical protein